MFVVILCVKVALNCFLLKVFKNTFLARKYNNKWNNFEFIAIIQLGSGSCPECYVPLRRNNFRVQMFEDPMVEKEVDIRRRILRDYNKKVECFYNVFIFQFVLTLLFDLLRFLGRGLCYTRRI